MLVLGGLMLQQGNDAGSTFKIRRNAYETREKRMITEGEIITQSRKAE